MKPFGILLLILGLLLLAFILGPGELNPYMTSLLILGMPVLIIAIALILLIR